MHQIPRRAAIQVAAHAGLAAALGTTTSVLADDDPAARPQTDRDFVLAAGMTEAEADAWAAAADAAGKFFALPELHPMDRAEVATAIHVIQNKLLSRPTYRKYLELAKAARG